MFKKMKQKIVIETLEKIVNKVGERSIEIDRMRPHEESIGWIDAFEFIANELERVRRGGELGGK